MWYEKYKNTHIITKQNNQNQDHFILSVQALKTLNSTKRNLHTLHSDTSLYYTKNFSKSSHKSMKHYISLQCNGMFCAIEQVNPFQ